MAKTKNNPLNLELTGLGWFYNDDKPNGFSLAMFKQQNKEMFEMMQDLHNQFEKANENFVPLVKEVGSEEFVKGLQENIDWWNKYHKVDVRNGKSYEWEISDKTIHKLGLILSTIQLLTTMEVIPNDNTNGMMYQYEDKNNLNLNLN